MEKNYYELLEIDYNATQAEIKKAFRRKALEYHPDKNSSPEAAEKFKEVSNAFKALSSPQEKEEYDMQLFGEDPGPEELSGGHYYYFVPQYQVLRPVIPVSIVSSFPVYTQFPIYPPCTFWTYGYQHQN